MNLSYAVERLLDTGWSPATLNRPDLERLPDGRPYPTVEAVRREFADAGFELSLKYDFTFNCCRATWSPSGDTPDPRQIGGEQHGTVVESSETEAAVHALAKLRASRAKRTLRAV